MSKTDKTRPWHVRVADQPYVTCAPVHRHERGVCTLPTDPLADLGEWPGCYWTPTARFWYGRDHGCCPRCSGTQWRRHSNRRDRRRNRQELKHALLREDWDVEPTHKPGAYWW